MIWADQKVEKLKELCYEGKNNKEIAEILGCSLNEVYAKRSQLGITINKCKQLRDINITEPKERSKGLSKKVKQAFNDLQDVLLLEVASDWTSDKDANAYSWMSYILISLEESFNEMIKNKI